MEVGDLVILQFCHQHGKIGMITVVPKPSHLSQSNPSCSIYWVSFNGGHQCFTGNQLELMRM